MWCLHQNRLPDGTRHRCRQELPQVLLQVLKVQVHAELEELQGPRRQDLVCGSLPTGSDQGHVVPERQDC